MLDRQKKKEINGKEYTLITMGAKESIQVTSKVMGLINLDDTDGDIGMAQMLMSLLGNDKVSKMIEDLTKNLTCDGKGIDFDSHFATHRKDLLPCVAFSLSENVLPFFDPDSLTQMAEMIATAMESSLDV